MNQLDNQQAINKQDYYGQIGGQTMLDKVLASKTYDPQKPSMGAKLSKVAEIFELDIIDEDEALKACKVIIGQHAKKQGEKVTIVK